jgi:hypothetical protein
VDEHLHPGRAGTLDVRAGGQAHRRVVHDVPSNQVANAREPRALEGALIEHRGVLVADADADRDPRRRRARRGHDGGDDGDRRQRAHGERLARPRAVRSRLTPPRR